MNPYHCPYDLQNPGPVPCRLFTSGLPTSEVAIIDGSHARDGDLGSPSPLEWTLDPNDILGQTSRGAATCHDCAVGANGTCRYLSVYIVL